MSNVHSNILNKLYTQWFNIKREIDSKFPRERYRAASKRYYPILGPRMINSSYDLLEMTPKSSQVIESLAYHPLLSREVRLICPKLSFNPGAIRKGFSSGPFALSRCGEFNITHIRTLALKSLITIMVQVNPAESHIIILNNYAKRACAQPKRVLCDRRPAISNVPLVKLRRNFRWNELTQ